MNVRVTDTIVKQAREDLSSGSDYKIRLAATCLQCALNELERLNPNSQIFNKIKGILEQEFPTKKTIRQ